MSSICCWDIVETKTITPHNGAQYINNPIYQSYCMAGCIVSPVSESNHIEGAACFFLTEYIPPNHASPWYARQERVASCTVKHILIRKIPWIVSLIIYNILKSFNYFQVTKNYFWYFQIVRLCYRKWLMLFSLKLQRDNRQNALSVAPAKRKTGEKGCIFNVLWRWNNHKL